MNDAVNQPAHYTAHPSGVECRQITGLLGGNISNIVKYVWRYGLEGEPVENLKKAFRYVAF